MWLLVFVLYKFEFEEMQANFFACEISVSDVNVVFVSSLKKEC